MARTEVAATQRQRMLSAALDLVAEKGITTTVADVVAAAGVSRKTFYEHFTDREDCLLATYDSCNEALLQHVAETDRHSCGAEQLREAVRAYLGFLAASPSLARAALVEGPTIGSRAIQHCAQQRRALAELLQGWHATAREQNPELLAAPSTAYTALAGAMHELAFQHVVTGHAGDLLNLEPDIMRTAEVLLNLPA